MLKMKRITETYDMRVFTDTGDYFGDIEESILLQTKVFGWRVRAILPPGRRRMPLERSATCPFAVPWKDLFPGCMMTADLTRASVSYYTGTRDGIILASARGGEKSEHQGDARRIVRP